MIDPKAIEQAAQAAACNPLAHPLAQGSLLAASGLAARRMLPPAPGLGLLRNPVLLFAGGLAAGYLLHKYEKEILAFVAKLGGMGKDFALQQRENLEDLLAEAEARQETSAASASPSGPDAATPTGN